MSWIFGNAKRGAPNAEIDGRAAAREQQIRNLHERIPHLQQKSSDNCLYEVEIRAPPDRRKVTLRVFLPTKFPDERPVLQLLSPVTHPWVNTYQQVHGHPALEGWNSDSPPMIGDVVIEVINEFGRDDADTTSSTASDPPLRSIPVSTPIPFTGPSIHRRFGQDVARPTETNVSHQPRQMHQTQTPGVPTEFPKLKLMTTAQIDRLLMDDDARKAMLMGEPSVIGLKEPCTAVWKENVHVAESTLLKQEEALVLREEAEELRTKLQGLLTYHQGAKIPSVD